MKRYQLYVLLIAGCLSAASCKKYLDQNPKTSESYVETARDCQLLLNNASIMNQEYPTDAINSSDDYYLLKSNYDPFGQENKDIYAWKPGAIRQLAKEQWQNPYKVVYYTNIVLEKVAELNGKENDSTLKSLRGAALVYRSFVFWTLAQQYAKPYVAATASQDMGIPIRTSSDLNDAFPRASVKDTYVQITKDLEEAVSVLPANVIGATKPSKVTAYALLARVYLSMGDYEKALANANAALQIKSDLLDFNTLDPNSDVPFKRFNKEVILHAVTAYSELLDPGWSPNDAISRVNPAIVNLYNADDLRKKLFIKPNTQGVVLDQYAELPDGSYRFSGNYDETNYGNLFCGLATDEIFLIRAECYARSNQPALAMADINKLLRTRYATGTYTDQSAPDGATALAIVLAERRKELLMRGLRWSDLRRLNLPATRSTRTFNFTGTVANPVMTETIEETYNLSAGDPRYALLIPMNVINLGHLPQNTR